MKPKKKRLKVLLLAGYLAAAVLLTAGLAVDRAEAWGGMPVGIELDR